MKIVPALMAGLVFLGGVAVYGQSAPPVPPPPPRNKQPTKTILGGLVNRFAILLPQPEYPADVTAANAAGVIAVTVLINETGNVVQAKATSGPEIPSARKAAEKAALQAKFNPLILSGSAVNVLGRIDYNFPADEEPKHFYVVGASAWLGTIRYLAEDTEKMDAFLGGVHFSTSGMDDYPQYAADFKSLEALETLAVNKRYEKIDAAAASFKGKLTGTQKWEFDVGQSLSGIMGAFIKSYVTEPKANDDLILDAATIDASLLRLKELLDSPPPTFPNDQLQKLMSIEIAAEKADLKTAKGLKDLAKSVLDTFAALENRRSK